MNKKYNQLNYEQRYTIARMLKQGKSQTEIAETIGVHKSTVSREIKRNKTEKRGVYHQDSAQMYTQERKEWRCRKTKFTRAMKQRFESLLLAQKWSPEQIVGRSRLEGIPMVGKTTLYTYLHKDKAQGGTLYLSCRHSLKYRKKRLSSQPKSKWGKRKSIDDRPECINQQLRMGDFEMDTIVSPNHKGVILTLTDRKTDYALIQKLPFGKNAKKLARTVNATLAHLKRRGLLHSITTDNGTEFTHFYSIERALKIPVFFANPYCSTDKPHIEHLNKLIRQYIKKSDYFDDLSQLDLTDIQAQLNNRPEKKLGFRTPFEVFFLDNL